MNGVNVRIEFDKQKLADLVEVLGRFPKALPMVISRALNRTAQSMRSHVASDAAHALGVAVRLVKARIHTSWAREDKLCATVYIDDKGFSLYLFKPVQTRMGVVTTRGFIAEFPHAFIATPWKNTVYLDPETGKGTTTMPTPLPGQFNRVLRSGQDYAGVYIRKGKDRFPLLTQRSDGAVETIQKLGGWDARYTEALQYLEERLAFETERVLAGGKATAVASALNESWQQWTSRMGAEYGGMAA